MPKICRIIEGRCKTVADGAAESLQNGADRHLAENDDWRREAQVTKERFGSSLAASCGAFALFWVMQRYPFFGSIFAPDVSFSHESRFVADAAILLFSVALFFLPFADKALASRRFALASGIVDSAGVICSLAAHLLGAGVLLVPAGLLIAAGFVGLSASMMHLATKLSAEGQLALIPLSFLISLALGMADALPLAFRLTAFACIPLGIGTLLLGLKDDGRSLRPLSHQAPSRSSHERLLDAGALAFILVEALVLAIFRGTWNSGVGYSFTSHSIVSYVTTAVMAVAVVYVMAKASRPPIAFVQIAGASVAIILLVACVYVVASIRFCSAMLTSLQTTLFVVAFALFGWRLSCGEGTLRRSSALATGMFASCSIITCDFVAVFFSLRNDPSAYIYVSFVVVVIMCVWLAISTVVVFRNGMVGASTPADATAASAPDTAATAIPDATVASAAVADHNSKFALLEKHFGMTARESEVALLFASGFTQKRAAEQLCISHSTVQSHMKSVYRKTGVHNRNELIDVLTPILDGGEPPAPVPSPTE